MPDQHVHKKPEKPTMLFDGDCGFCRSWIDRWQQVTGSHVRYEPYQEVLSAYTPLSEAACREAVQLVDTDGSVYSGAHAVLKSLNVKRCYAWLLYIYEQLPLFRRFSERVYRFVADHRSGLSRLTRFFYGSSAARSTYTRSIQIYRVGMGAVYTLAFASAAVQIQGLIGSSGILPAVEMSAQVKASGAPWWAFPSLVLLNSSDIMLIGLCIGGLIASVALMVGLFIPLAAAVCWLAYLSITVAGQTFYSFQWDALLLEAGFLLIWLFPLCFRIRFKESIHPFRGILFLHHLLLFKLMFSSGAVKLLSGDESWRKLTAMTYHYWTQPLPSRWAWYADKLPDVIHQWTCGTVLLLELVIPFFFFMPRRVRHVAAWATILLQFCIAVTGSYTFFNLLTVLLCLLLLDDTFWRRSPAGDRSLSRSRAAAYLLIPVCSVLLLMNAMVITSTLNVRVAWPQAVKSVQRALMPFRVVNAYGLFAVMTTRRPELIIQGSMDGRQWQDYTFAWKPGSLTRPPRYAAPYQPRLDWQCWFAALGRAEHHPWFYRLVARLLAGDSSANGLFASVPFTDQPPRYIRVVKWQYRFTTFEERQASGRWWERERPELYLPVMQRR